MSNEKEKTELLYYEGGSFMGLNQKMGVFVDFTKMRKSQGFVEFTGKQGVGKTARLFGIAYGMGAALGIEKDKLINRIDGEISEAIGAKKGDAVYRVEISSSRASVKRQAADGKFKVDNEDTPANLIRDIFGPVSLFPNIKEMDGKKQILFFQKIYGGEGAGSKKIAETEEKIDKVFNERTRINGDAKLLGSALEVEPLYQNYEKSQERFSKPISAQKEKAKFEELAKKKNAYEQYQNTLSVAKGELSDTQNYIAELEAKLVAARKKETELSASVKKGEEWVSSNKSILTEFETANKEWLNLSQLLADQEKWQDILRREKQHTEKIDKGIELTGELEELRGELLKLTKKCLPKVPGLSVKVNNGLDKTKPHGVFYIVPGKEEEQPIHELSESEYADMWCLIWAESGSQFIFIENISSFGNNVVDTLTQFVKNGGTVFYTKMDRGLNGCEVIFKSKVE